jgi:integrase
MDFTVKELAKVQPGPKRFAVMDSKTPGLALRVTPAGGKSWYYVYRMGGRGTLLRWMLVGKYESMPLNRAQELARAYRAKVDAGIDPAEEIREAHTLGETIAGLAKKYREEVLVKKSPSTREGYGGSIDLYIIPKLGKIAVRTLMRDQVTSWHSKIPHPVAANRALSVLRLMMNLAIDVWGMRPDGLNPASKVERNDEAPRKRDIELREITAIGEAIRALKGKHSLWALAAVEVTALCCGRVSEVLSLRRDKGVDLDQGFAILKKHKNRRKAGDRRLQLPSAAVAILRALPAEVGNPYYFPGRIKGKAMTRDGLHKTWMAVREKAGLHDLVIHDFRSWGASEAEEQGISAATRTTLFGHSAATEAKHYTRARGVGEAADKIADVMARALAGKSEDGGPSGPSTKFFK